MVRGLFFLSFFLFSFSLASEVKISAFVESHRVSPKLPIVGVIKLEHDVNVDVDTKSFQMEGKALLVEKVSQQQQTSLSLINGSRNEKHLIITTYHFQLEAREAGLYPLPPISVKVGGQTVYSQGSTFEVVAPKKTKELQLEADIQGSLRIYPGQRTKFVYRIFMHQDVESIEWLRQDLPLLEAKGLKKIGSPKVEVYHRHPYKVQQIVQEVEAKEVGRFFFPASEMEGVYFERDFWGRRLSNRKIYAQSHALELSVEPFPSKGRPLSFNGAVGEFSCNVSLLSSPSLREGDKLKLEVEILGKGNLESLQAPSIAQQAAFKGQFRFSDLPIVGRASDDSKVFVVELRPLSSEIREIPGIEFSFFNPITRRFHTQTSRPIPIQVAAVFLPKNPSLSSNELEGAISSSEGKNKKELSSSQWVEIAGNYSSIEPLDQTKLFWKGDLFPLGLLFLFLQAFIQNQMRKRKAGHKKGGRFFLKEAMKYSHQPEIFFQMLDQALLVRLKEKKLLDTSITSCRLLPQGNITGEIREFFHQVDEAIYAKGAQTLSSELIKKSKALVQKVEAYK